MNPAPIETVKVSALIEEQALTREELLTSLRQMMEIRALENNIADLLNWAVLRGASHLYAGEEAVAVGAIAALRGDDLVTSTHRGHGHAHAHGDKAAKTLAEKQAHFNKMMAEVLGKSGGYCKGKGGSMHIADVVHGNLGATGIVGGNIPVAVGAALAQKVQGTDRVILCFFGDGASNTGNFHEALNMASAWDLPVVFVVENNQYGMSTPFARVSKLPDIAARACAYGIPGVVVDGMDVLEIRAAVAKGVARARAGEGPTLIEAKTYRYYGHSHSDPRAYRTRDEEKEWRDRDAIQLLKRELLAMNFLTEAEFNEMDRAVKAKLDAAMAYSQASPEPDPSEVDTDVYVPLKTTAADVAAEAELRARVHAAEASLPTAGAGLPTAGAGLPTAGAGLPTAGAGLPAAGAGLPTAGAGLPTAGAGLPTAGAGLPTAGAGLPTAGAGLPTAGAGLPTAGAGLPTAGAGLPTAGAGLLTVPPLRQITYVQALIEAMREEMKRDPRVFIMGEDVGLYGGAYGATRGLVQEFGAWRVIDTPISEATIGGAAIGAAMAGMRPIAEIMYVDFTPLAMDQIANQGAKNRYMFGGKTTVPMVIRTEGGAGRAIAAHHSQSLESLWTHFPGIYVVMPSTPYDAKGLLKAAIRDDNPVMFIEHKMLYGTKGPVPDASQDYIIPLGVADVKRPGKDVTLVTYSRMVGRALEAAEQLAKEGIDVEVIDLRTLKPLDIDTIIASVKKTGRFVGVTEAYENTSFINEVMAQVNELAFDYLDAPMVRVASLNVPVPRAEVLEDAAIPNVARIVAACRKSLS
jgi:2-oxoisovalerate dehydrogenase E1 component